MSILLQCFGEFSCTPWCVLYAIWSRHRPNVDCAVKDMGAIGKYMSDLLHMPPKQKLNIKIDKDVENRVGMIKELVMVRGGLMGAKPRVR